MRCSSNLSYVLYALQELAWAYGITYGDMFPNVYGTNSAFNGFSEGVVSGVTAKARRGRRKRGSGAGRPPDM